MVRALQPLAWVFQVEGYFTDRAVAAGVERELAECEAALHARVEESRQAVGRAARGDRGTMPNSAIATTVERPWR